MKFSELENLFKENFDIDHLADMARELGVSPQAVSNWKARDRVPYKYILLIRSTIRENYNNVSKPRSKVHIKENNENPISLSKIIAVLNKHVKLVIFVPTFIVIAAIIEVLFIASPVYTSTSRIIPTNMEGSEIGISSLARQFGISVGGNEKNPMTRAVIYPQIIRSRVLGERIIKREFYTNKYGKNLAFLNIVLGPSKKKNRSRIEIEKEKMLAINEYMSMVKVSRDLETQVLTISTNTNEPRFSAELNKAIIEDLDLTIREFKLSAIREKLDFIAGRIKTVEKDLRVNEELLKNFRIQNRNYKNSPNLLLEEERLQREVQVQTGIFITLKQQFEVSQIEVFKQSASIQILDSPIMPLVRTKPKRKLIVTMSGIFGLGLGILSAFYMEFMNTNGLALKKEIRIFVNSIINIFFGFIKSKKNKY